jgi:hypothetical protein
MNAHLVTQVTERNNTSVEKLMNAVDWLIEPLHKS